MVRTNALIDNEIITIGLNTNETVAVPDGNGFKPDRSSLLDSVSFSKDYELKDNGEVFYNSNYDLKKVGVNGQLEWVLPQLTHECKDIHIANDGNLFVLSDDDYDQTNYRAISKIDADSGEVIWYRGWSRFGNNIDGTSLNSARDICWFDNGNKAIITDSNYLHKIEVSTPYRINTSTSLQNEVTPPNYVDDAHASHISNDGKSLIVFGSLEMQTYELGTAFDLTTLTQIDTVAYSSQTSIDSSPNIEDISKTDDQNIVTISEAENGQIYNIEFSTPFDVTTASVISQTNLENQFVNNRIGTGISWSPDGTKLIVIGRNTSGVDGLFSASVNGNAYELNGFTATHRKIPDAYSDTKLSFANSEYKVYESSNDIRPIYFDSTNESQSWYEGRFYIQQQVTQFEDDDIVIIDEEHGGLDLLHPDGNIKTADFTVGGFTFGNLVSSGFENLIAGTDVTNDRIVVIDKQGNTENNYSVNIVRGGDKVITSFEPDNLNFPLLVYAEEDNQYIEVLIPNDSLTRLYSYTPSGVSSNSEKVFHSTGSKVIIPYRDQNKLVEVDVISRSVESIVSTTPQNIETMIGVDGDGDLYIPTENTDQLTKFTDWEGTKAYETEIAIAGDGDIDIKGSNVKTSGVSNDGDVMKMVLQAGDKIKTGSIKPATVSFRRIK